MENTVSIGKLVATFGLKGELVLVHGLGGKTDLHGVKVLFLEMQRGSKLPYFLESSKSKSATETLVKLEGIETKEKASAIIQKQVWLDELDFNRLVKPNATIALLGYEIMEDKTAIGTIGEIIEQPHQVLCSVMVGQKEALIPLNEATLKGIDRKKRQVFVELPDGLLDIYLH
jgi:16S rRNA processing protein RimM